MNEPQRKIVPIAQCVHSGTGWRSRKRGVIRAMGGVDTITNLHVAPPAAQPAFPPLPCCQLSAAAGGATRRLTPVAATSCISNLPHSFCFGCFLNEYSDRLVPNRSGLHPKLKKSKTVQLTAYGPTYIYCGRGYVLWALSNLGRVRPAAGTVDSMSVGSH